MLSRQQYCICVLLIKFPKTSMSILTPAEQLSDDKACLNKVFFDTIFCRSLCKTFLNKLKRSETL